MEPDARGYSVLAINEIREKIKKEIDQISEIFSLSKSDATVILIHLKFNSYKASDLLSDKKEEFLSELGLVQVSDSYSSSARLETMTLSDRDGDGDYLVSTPFCSHKFSINSWSEYLTDALNKNKDGRKLISCLNQDCVASVGPDLIEKLSDSVKDMYESYTLESFMEGNKDEIKWCPAPGCVYAIELHYGNVEDDDSAVVCSCGHIFCWTCQIESHRPVTCEIASLWCNNLLDQARSISWIHKNTKSCPNCNSPVQQIAPGYRIIICTCSFIFCWACLRPEEEHYGESCRFAVSAAVWRSSTELTQILHANLFDTGDEALEEAKSKLRALEDKIIPKLVQNWRLSEQNITTLREAGMLIVQCRQVLKWSSLFDYFIPEYKIAKKQHLQHQLDEALTILCQHERFLHELMEGAPEFNNFTSFKDITSYIQELRTSTSLTGNYFHGFVKNLEDGMPEVKDEPNENGPDNHRLCARCKFDNIAVDEVCMRCFLPLNPPLAVSFDNNNNNSAENNNNNNSANVSRRRRGFDSRYPPKSKWIQKELDNQKEDTNGAITQMSWIYDAVAEADNVGIDNTQELWIFDDSEVADNVGTENTQKLWIFDDSEVADNVGIENTQKLWIFDDSEVADNVGIEKGKRFEAEKSDERKVAARGRELEGKKTAAKEKAE